MVQYKHLLITGESGEECAHWLVSTGSWGKMTRAGHSDQKCVIQAGQQGSEHREGLTFLLEVTSVG